MTAGIFAQHGVWFGRCGKPRSSNRKGDFENRRIKQEQIKRWGMLTLAKKRTEFEGNPVCTYQPGFTEKVRQILSVEGYESGPWGYKQSALYKDAWRDFDPMFIGVRRCNVLQANRTRQKMMGTDDPERIRRMIELHDRIIDECEVIVRTDDVVQGDYSSLERAFEYCGLDFDPKIADEFVDASLWHH